MNYHKKAVAFTSGLLICLTSATPLLSTYAETENYDDEIMPINIEADTTITSGDFSYIIDDDNNAHITGCSSTNTEITIPNTIDGLTVTELESNAFLESQAEKINIPATIEYISSENPFASCLNMKEFSVDESNEYYCSSDGILFTKDMKKLIFYPPQKEGTSYNIPDSVEEIGIAAFSESGLTEIKVPDSVNKIGRHAFSFNETLIKIDLSQTSVKIIDLMTFINCTSLNEVLLPETLTNIELASFMGCEKLSEITLPSQLTSIGQSSFMGTAIEKIRIPENVTYIGYCAFGYDMEEKPNSNLVIIGKANSIAQNYATDTDDEYGIQNNFTFITAEAYDAEEEYLALNPITSGDYEYAIIDGEACIAFCTSINDTVNVPDDIDGYKVTSIYRNAFYACEAKNIILPETVKSIGENAFSSVVESITIPGGCTTIDGDEPFLNCSSLKEINVTENGDGTFSSESGVLYNKDKTILLAYPVQKSDKSFTVPKSVTEIGLSSFCYNEYLEDIDLSNTKIIGNYAFEACPNIKSVKFSDNLNFVGNHAFIGNTSLMSVRLPENIETIGDYAFGYQYDAELAQNIADAQNSGLTDENTETPLPFSVIDGFKIYTEEDSLAWQYCQACNIEAVSNTTSIGGKNVDNNFIAVIGGTVGVVILAIIAVFTGRSIKNKKKTNKEKKA
ncbi:MAG: leucine-rich repeat domain-containing protein [Ruminococcus sp.]|nr:leucine-rich repeat domain-containing protein [Ruminococcus sp.]